MASGSRVQVPLLLLALGLLLLLPACGDGGTEPTRPAISRADSLLVASLVGRWSYADTTLVAWSAAGRADSVRQVQRGEIVVTQIGTAAAVSLARTGTDSIWTSHTAGDMVFGRGDLPEGIITIEGDMLVGFGGPTVPRSAVSDSGLHWATTRLAEEPCATGVLLSLMPDDATGVRCHAAVHWRRLP